jgi:intein/homing endonuclease
MEFPISYDSVKEEQIHKRFRDVKDVSTEEWKPTHPPLEYSDDFVKWIDSINSGWRNMKVYHRFELYKQQARIWLNEGDDITNYYTPELQEDYIIQEYRRCADNTLYFANKYGWLKEGEAMAGKLKYKAWPAQQMLLFLLDSWYNLMLGKARQIGFTTTMGLAAAKRINFNYSYYVKFITHTKEKGEEIFRDKIRWGFGQIEPWIREEAFNDAHNILSLKSKGVKGETSGSNSRIEVSTPTVDAINGGSPNLVLIDEIGLFNLFGQMMTEGRPALYYFNPSNQRMEMRRQLIAWGCVCKGTKVWTSDGKLVNIEDITLNTGILGYSGNGTSKEPVTYLKPPAEKLCYKITLDGGDFLECSHDHPIMVVSKQNTKGKHNSTFLLAENLQKGVNVAMIDKVDVFGSKRFKDARLLGMMIGDGNYSHNAMPRLYTGDIEIYQYLKKAYQVKEYRKREDVNNGNFWELSSPEFRGILKEAGILGQTKEEKRLPDNIHEYDNQSVRELIAGLFDTDGYVKLTKKKSVVISLTSTNTELLREVKFLLMKLGIRSNLLVEKRNPNSSKISSGQKDYIARLYISEALSISRFIQDIDLLVTRHHKKLSEYKKPSKTYAQKESRFVMSDNGKGAHFEGNESLNGYRLRRVVSIECIGMKPVYNLTAGNTHTYLANGIITHNTGGSVKKEGAAFEFEFKAAMNAWKERNFKYGIIPLFFDAYARQGFNEQLYESEKKVYYSKGGTEAETSKVQFHQHFPICIDDMFLRTAKTILPVNECNVKLSNIYNLKPQDRPQYGYFEPVYDTNSPTQDGELPFKLMGATFMPSEGITDPRTTVCIFRHPPMNEKWKYRFYQGTDPINSETGHSKMSSSVWDAFTNTVSAAVFTRDKNFKESYLQCALLGMYYDVEKVKGGIPELLENNIGTMYQDFLDKIGLGRRLVPNAALPPYFQTPSSAWWGIKNNSATAPRITNKIIEMIDVYADNIFIPWFWMQCKTFVEKDLKTQNTQRQTRYQAADLRYDFDDVIFSTVFAYINAQAHSRYEPFKHEGGEVKKRKIQYVQNKETGFRLRLAEIDDRGKVLRFL